MPGVRPQSLLMKPTEPHLDIIDAPAESGGVRAVVGQAAATSTRAPLGWKLLGALLRPFLRIRTEPVEPGALLDANATPLVYILERAGVSNMLILEEACREAGLPPPLRRTEPLALGVRQRAVMRRTRSRAPAPSPSHTSSARRPSTIEHSSPTSRR